MAVLVSDSSQIIHAAIEHHQAGRLQEAAALYQQVLQSAPEDINALHLLGVVAFQAGNHAAAVDLIEKAISLNPTVADFHSNLGNTRLALGDIESAITSYERAVLIEPDSPVIQANLARVLGMQGRHSEAIAHYEKAIALQPDYPGAYRNLGSLYREQGEQAAAIRCFRRALEYAPDDVPARNDLGNLLKDAGRLDAAINCYEQVLASQPDHAVARSNLLLSLNYPEESKPEEVFRAHLEFGKIHELSAAHRIKPYANGRDTERRLRVGYVSPDFRGHSVASFIESVLQHHDHAAIEVCGYFCGGQRDEVTERFQGYFDQWREIGSVPDAEVVALVEHDKIDILVDLAGHTGENRLLVFAQKPAPVQVTWLGYPNTTGLSTVDYRITDEIADPVGVTDTLYSEELVRLPHCFSCYRAPDNCPEVSGLPAGNRGYITFGSFNHLAKLNPAVVTAWSKILQAVPQAHLVLKGSGLGEESTRSQLLQAFAERDIPAERVEIYGWDTSRETHLRRYQQIDIGLDPFPYNGSTTTCEALWMGVPVVTLAGGTHASRVGMSHLKNLGLDELIAMNAEEYTAAAVALASDLERLEKLRSGMRRRMLDSPLMDGAGFTRQLEAAYRKIWIRWCEERDAR